MCRFAKQIFVSPMMFFGCKVSNENALKPVPMNNQ